MQYRTTRLFVLVLKHTHAPRYQHEKTKRTQKHKTMNSALRRLEFKWQQRRHLHGTAASTSLKSTVILLYLCCGGESILVRSRTTRFGSIGGVIKDLLVVLDFI